MYSSIISKSRRIMALALVLAMTLTTLGGYVPTWFSAFAEDAAAQPETAPVDDPASDQEEEMTAANLRSS